MNSSVDLLGISIRDGTNKAYAVAYEDAHTRILITRRPPWAQRFSQRHFSATFGNGLCLHLSFLRPLLNDATILSCPPAGRTAGIWEVFFRSSLSELCRTVPFPPKVSATSSLRLKRDIKVGKGDLFVLCSVPATE